VNRLIYPEASNR